MNDERPDKCPTCGSDDPAEYASPCDRALYSDDRSDPFHRSHEGVPSRVGLHGNVVAPKPQGLDAVSGDGTWDEADERYVAAMNTPNTTPERVTLIVTRDGRVSSVLGHGTIGNPRMDADAVEYVRADILRDLREAVERHREWSTRGGREPDKMSHADRELYAALASLDEQESA